MRRAHQLGLLTSLLVHGGLATALLWAWQAPGSHNPSPAPHAVAVSLHMFAEPEPPAPVATPVLPQPPEPAPVVEQEPPPSPVEVVTRPAPVAEAAIPTPPPTRVAPRVAAKAPPVIAPRPRVAERAQVASLRPVIPAPPAQQVDRDAVRERYRQALLADIMRHRLYPTRARRRGHQGEVRVRFRIESDGRLTAIELADGSGSALLDRAALRTLQRLGRTAPLPPELALHHWDLVVPIAFRLRGTDG